MTEINPQNPLTEAWVIVQIPDGYKLFRSIETETEDRWYFNSGITKIEKQNESYTIHGQSGSKYHCMIANYGTTQYGQSILKRLFNVSNGKVKAMENRDDWSEFDLSTEIQANIATLDTKE